MEIAGAAAKMLAEDEKAAKRNDGVTRLAGLQRLACQYTSDFESTQAAGNALPGDVNGCAAACRRCLFIQPLYRYHASGTGTASVCLQAHQFCQRVELRWRQCRSAHFVGGRLSAHWLLPIG